MIKNRSRVFSPTGTCAGRWTMILTRLELHYCANISAECMHGLKRLHHLGFTLIGEDDSLTKVLGDRVIESYEFKADADYDSIASAHSESRLVLLLPKEVSPREVYDACLRLAQAALRSANAVTICTHGATTGDASASLALLPLVPSSDGRPSGTAAEAANVRARARHDERAALIELPVRRDDAPPNFMLPWKEADEIR